MTRAAEELYLTPQTISGQLRQLEEQVGSPLFSRDGRHLVLTDTGRLVFSYADEMFRLGLELQDGLAGQAPGSALTVQVGIAMVVPKLIALRVTEPVLKLPDPVSLISHEAPLADLLADLAVHKLHMVLANSPVNLNAEYDRSVVLTDAWPSKCWIGNRSASVQQPCRKCLPQVLGRHIFQPSPSESSF